MLFSYLTTSIQFISFFCVVNYQWRFSFSGFVVSNKVDDYESRKGKDLEGDYHGL